MATQLLGGNRAYYTPSFFGSGNAAFDPSGGVGTAAIGEAGVLRDLISAMLQGFTPGPGRQMSGGVDLGGSDFGSGAIGGDAGAIGGSDTPVNPIAAQQTLNTLSKAGQTLGLISGMTGNPDLGNFLNTAGQLSGAVAGAYNDPVREALETQFNRDLEMSGLEGNIDYGRYGYDPSLVAASNIAPIIANVAGANPILGGLAREGLMMAADPVPSTPADLVKSGVDALVPGILNGVIKALTGNTIGEQMKGALTPVDESIARTPEEIAEEEMDVFDAIAGITREAASENPTPVGVEQIQAEEDIGALQEAIAQDVSMQGTVVNESPFANVQDMEEAFQQEMEAAAASTANPEITGNVVQNEVSAPATPTASYNAAAAGGGLAMFPAGFSLNLSPGWLDGISIGGMMPTLSPEAQQKANEFMQNLLSGNTPTTPTTPVTSAVASIVGDGGEYTVTPDLAPIEQTNAIFNESSYYDSPTTTGDSWDSFDYSGYSFG